MNSDNSIVNQEKDRIRDSIEILEQEITEINIDPDNFFPDDDKLPGLNLNTISFDYKGEIEKIREECQETLNCLSSLYLTEDIVNKKNVNNIIQNDAQSLCDLKFSLSMSKRALINLMEQIDNGVNHPEMYEAVGTFQKEIRDSIKMLYDIQKRMKDFYKELKDELSNINTGEEEITETGNSSSIEKLTIVDFKSINKQLDEYKESTTNKNKRKKK
jgi:hypothetical protein